MIAAIVQARMGSIRLPGKVMMDLAGKPVLWHIVTRLQHATLLNRICVATTREPEDNEIEAACRDWGITVCRGSRDDVLSRYYTCAKQIGMQAGRADCIVRITADCPFVDPAIVDHLVEKMVRGQYDYGSNVDPPSFPDGLDVEIFSFDTLETAALRACLPSDREHVTPFIRKNKAFLKYNYARTPDISGLRLTLDTAEDFRLITLIYDALYSEGEIIPVSDVLGFLHTRPDISAINAGYKRNEGYDKSLSQDRMNMR
jgi:spore coat polysaccharide biosynthesis protein SpsF (cytidylyltransferase family)